MHILTSADMTLTNLRKCAYMYAHVLRGEEVWLQIIGWYGWGPVHTAKGKVATDSVPIHYRMCGCMDIVIVN